ATQPNVTVSRQVPLERFYALEISITACRALGDRKTIGQVAQDDRLALRSLFIRRRLLAPVVFPAHCRNSTVLADEWFFLCVQNEASPDAHRNGLVARAAADCSPAGPKLE